MPFQWKRITEGNCIRLYIGYLDKSALVFKLVSFSWEKVNAYLIRQKTSLLANIDFFLPCYNVCFLFLRLSLDAENCMLELYFNLIILVFSFTSTCNDTENIQCYCSIFLDYFTSQTIFTILEARKTFDEIFKAF